MWVTAKELIGLTGVPTRVHNIRAMLDRLSTEESKRKRQGTKAFEYQLNVLPVPIQTAFYKREEKVQVGEQVLDLPKKEQNKPTYCREALWAGWNKTNNSAKRKRAKH